MTYQPPPPPPGSQPPPPPPGQWGPPPGGSPGGSGGFDPKRVNPLDWAILAIGAVVFIFSFFDYYTADSYKIDGYEVGGGSLGAWHTSSGTFVPWLAMLVGVAATVVVALAIFAPTVKMPLAGYVAALIGFVASLVLYLIGFAAVDLPDSVSFGFSYWLSFILVIAGAVLSLMRAQQTNTALPGPLAGIPKIGK